MNIFKNLRNRRKIRREIQNLVADKEATSFDLQEADAGAGGDYNEHQVNDRNEDFKGFEKGETVLELPNDVEFSLLSPAKSSNVSILARQNLKSDHDKNANVVPCEDGSQSGMKLLEEEFQVLFQNKNDPTKTPQFEEALKSEAKIEKVEQISTNEQSKSAEIKDKSSIIPVKKPNGSSSRPDTYSVSSDADTVRSNSSSSTSDGKKKLVVRGLKRFISSRGGSSHPPTWVRDFPFKSKYHVDNYICGDFEEGPTTIKPNRMQNMMPMTQPQKKSGRCDACGIYSVDTCRCCKKCPYDCKCPQLPKALPELGVAFGDGWTQAQKVICELSKGNSRRGQNQDFPEQIQNLTMDEKRAPIGRKPRDPEEIPPHLRCHIDVMNPTRPYHAETQIPQFPQLNNPYQMYPQMSPPPMPCYYPQMTMPQMMPMMMPLPQMPQMMPMPQYYPSPNPYPYAFESPQNFYQRQ